VEVDASLSFGWGIAYSYDCNGPLGTFIVRLKRDSDTGFAAPVVNDLGRAGRREQTRLQGGTGKLAVEAACGWEITVTASGESVQ